MRGHARLVLHPVDRARDPAPQFGFVGRDMQVTFLTGCGERLVPRADKGEVADAILDAVLCLRSSIANI